ncbi:MULTISPECIES: M15 family metallopeptidase [unclassified Cobetia]|uniref:M15 family metallopeptidase n=1 Tax=unclassified Cobetia TaxID=2609414 RepID=UPI00178CFBB1|nr:MULTISPECIES: M15 family metallopeptidase [unclassified Cobetia]MBE2168007.1 M15 family metallopeptidase [Cobetia sp. 2AS1]MDH2293650.1 M15 family metallopeptidase [Cobetia sp. 1AS1]MDH2446430.1 M15 family metallopeptidase [Cobetia sp. 2AS]
MTSTLNRPIPPIPSHDEPDWTQVTRIPVKGCGSTLVPTSLGPSCLKVYPAYARLGIPGAVNECLVRRAVYQRLLQAARALPQGLSLVVMDGWRPWRVQQYLFETLYQSLKTHDPELDEAQLLARTREFVSLPSRDPDAPSPHLTGGAVDVTLCDADGLLLEMGTLFDEATPESHADHFERHPPASDTPQAEARDNRRLLYHVMTEAGFTNLPSEWWHFDFGDQLWAWYRGEPEALFGPAEMDSIESLWKRSLA